MIQLATQLIDRQTGTYDPADVEDRRQGKGGFLPNGFSGNITSGVVS